MAQTINYGEDIMAYIGPFPVKVEQGGTGDTSVTANAVVIGDTADQLASTNVGTNGQLLIGATAAAPAFASLTSTGGTITFTPGANTLNLEVAGGSAIDTINGNSGSVTGSTITITTGASNTQGTALFTGSGSTLTMTFSDISDNLGLGTNSLHSLSGGNTNVAYGPNSGLFVSSGAQNCLVGDSAGVNVSSGNYNSFFGNGSGGGITSGSYNVACGYNAGMNWGGGGTGAASSSIAINSTGIAGDTNVLRIGDATGSGARDLAAAYICGIDGVNVGSVSKVLTMASDQLGTATITAGSNITVTPGANTITIATTGSTGGAETFHTDSGNATASSNAITIAGGGGISTSGSGSTVTITATGGGFTWHDVTGGSATLAAQNGYIADSGSLTTFTMPTNNAFGDTIKIVGKGTGLWKIVYGTGQNIVFGSSTSTTTTGNISSTNAGDCIEMVCTTASATVPIFTVVSSIGSPSIT